MAAPPRLSDHFSLPLSWIRALPFPSIGLITTLFLFYTPGLNAAPSASAPLKVSNRAATADEVGYLPRSDTPSSSNPPAIAWLNEPLATSWTLQVAPDASFTSPTIHIDDWPWLLYTHNQPLNPGHYYWRYRFTGTSRTLSTWSVTRQFDVSTTAVPFPRPSADNLASLVPSKHPRMFVRRDTLDSLRATATPDNPQLQALLRNADTYLTTPLMAEPKPWSKGVWDAGEWGQYLRQASTSTAQMDTLAFAWLLTGRSAYGDRAKAALLNYATWDPLGPSSMKVNDEVGMPVLHSVSRTYDWIQPLLSATEKEAVRRHIRARGIETYNHLRKTPYEQFAYNSHNGRMWHFLGEAGLAFYGEIPEAELWLNYAMQIFYGWYPIWGKEDGGWAEGMWYWSSYNTRVTWWLDLMQASLGLNGTDKPFYSHVGDFPLYVCPPGNPVAGFGDFSERPPPGTAAGEPMAAYALYKQNAAWQWYADSTSVSLAGSPFDYLRALRTRPAAAPPANLPLLKIFPEVGYALFHTDLTHPETNLHLAMRCSPFGNVSHSHNDQNAIVMSAYGDPLLVNTGTRDFYGSEFCKQYYWQTIAHNSILFDGKGQVRARNTEGSFLASGEIPGKLAWIVGDATKAYPGLVDLYRRWIIFLPGSGAVMIDEIQTTASTATVLFHGRAPFKFEDWPKDPFADADDPMPFTESSSFSLTKGRAHLQANIDLWPSLQNVKFSQTDHYPLPLGNNKKPLFNEWHLRADVPLEKNYPLPQYIITSFDVSPSASKPDKRTTNSYRWSDHTATLTRSFGSRPPVSLTIDFKNLTVRQSD